jgi:hypothetical protein
VALTIKEIENAKPKDKKYKLADGVVCVFSSSLGVGSSGFGAVASMAPRRI